MKRVFRAVVWVGLLITALWIARAALKRWIDGPEVTPESGDWGDSASRHTPSAPSATSTTSASSRSPSPAHQTGQVISDPARGGGGDAESAAEQELSKEEGESGSGTKASGAKKAAKAAGKKAAGAGAGKRRTERSEPGAWVVPNGSADVLLSHPIKAKLSSRVYRVPGMPMYDRTVADRCYPTVEAAEADGFNRAAR